MKHIIKNALKRAIKGAVGFMGKTSVGRYLYSQIIREAMGRKQVVQHSGQQLIFATPNALNQYRADSFSTKEPETLEWIDSLSKGSVLWDIGANVGLYSCYAAKQRDCKVFAFEPSVFNLELLARNIFSNGLTEKITIVPLPLSDVLARNKLNMTSTEWGGALSTFGEEYGHDGQAMVSIDACRGEVPGFSEETYGHIKVFEFPTIGLSMDQAIEDLDIPAPDYIKMDVDGIEHLILKGGEQALRSAKGVLIEINDKFEDQANDSKMYLERSGFLLKEKRHAEQYNTGVAMHTFNQIWVRNS